jgi:hypothetical protein
MTVARSYSRFIREQFLKHPAPTWTGLFSTILLSIFLVLQAVDSPMLKLPVQWVGLALMPFLLALLLGGYVKKFGAAGLQFETGPRLDPELRDLKYVSQASSVTLTRATSEPERTEVESPADVLPGEERESLSPERIWTTARDSEYERSHYFFLVHAYEPSTIPGQLFDITIYLMHHVRGTGERRREGLSDVEKAEFYFGQSWRDEIYSAENTGGVIGVRTSAWAPFLATCRVTFRDSSRGEVILHRYVDFEMAPKQAP